jgi:hypothetical protein
MARTATVTRPIAVLPTMNGPSHLKWRCHLCRRGLNSFVSFFVLGSRPAMFGPLWLLSCRQERARLASTVVPPCCWAMIWSMGNGTVG